MSVFTGREGNYIDIEEAQRLVHGNEGEMGAVFFGKEKLQELLNQAGSVGLRMYFAKTEAANEADRKETLVIVAVNSQGEDISTLVLDHGIGCPDTCDYTSLLMR